MRFMTLSGSMLNFFEDLIEGGAGPMNFTQELMDFTLTGGGDMSSASLSNTGDVDDSCK